MNNGYNSNNRNFSRAPKIIDLTGSRMRALIDNLEIVIKSDFGTKKKKDEVKDFTLYLNYALSNIREITGITEDNNKFKKALDSLSDEKLSRLADFLWTFRFDEPQFDFRNRDDRNFDYRHFAKLVALKIFELRNWFVHSDRAGNEALVCSHDLYVLLEGLLRPKAEEAAMGRGRKADKVYKMKFMNLREKNSDPQSRQYDLTRKGIIFLTCLALYKDDAEEFLSCFTDMRLPNRKRDIIDELNDLQIEALGKKAPTKRAMLDAFTFYSYRRGRVSVVSEDGNFLNFMNIIGYLNKVPKTSFDYLALEDEKQLLSDLASRSTESDENKLVKYDLSKQIRQKDRFVALAAAWCEDFDKLPSIRFKRLDITPSVGRKRYQFGKENDNAVRLERHYSIVDGAIRFEWMAKEHYGNVKVSSLRGSIGETEFRKLLWCCFFDSQTVNAKIDSYFSAYHKMLELMLNAKNTEDLSFENHELMTTVETITGIKIDEFKNNPSLLGKYIPANLTRFFSRTENKMTVAEMRSALNRRIDTMKAKQNDFLVRVKKFRDWRRKCMVADQKNIQRPALPTCGKKDVLNPPRECRVSNASCVARVFEWLNLNIFDPDKRLRQLPISEQHNKGTRDFEYQIAHRAIGKFSLDSKIFWGMKGKPSVIETLRPELKDAVSQLHSKCKEVISKNEEISKRKEARLELLDLAQSAAEKTIEFLDYLVDLEDEDLSWWCRLLGVRTGMPLDSESLIKTILGIDIDKWVNAYDYANGKKYQSRKLFDAEHIVSQIPVPNGFADRIILASPRGFLGVANDGKVDWHQAFERCEQKVREAKLRDFYSTAPLVEYIRSHLNHLDEMVDRNASGVNTWRDVDPRRLLPDFSRGGINKAISAIKTAHNQDRLLLVMAFDYWREYNKANAYEYVKQERVTDKVSVREYFDGERIRMLGKTQIKLRVSRNDVFSPTFAHVMANARLIAPMIEGEFKECKSEGVCFSDVAQIYSREQRKCRYLRLDLIPLIINFESKCSIPNKVYDEINNKDISIDDKNKEISKMEFERYAVVFPSLTEEEYHLLADVRNSVMHSDALMPGKAEIDSAKKIFERCLREYKPKIGGIKIIVS